MKNKKQFLASAAAVAVVTAAVVPTASAATADFKDLNQAADHKDAILKLVEKGIVKGYPDNTFKPNNSVTRGNVTKFLGKWLVSEGYEIPKDYKTKQRFKDVPLNMKDVETIEFAALVKDSKVFNGTADGRLMHQGQMSREAMAVVLVRALKEVYDVDLVALSKEKSFKSKFTDLQTAMDNEKREAIVALEYAGITVVPAHKKYNPKGNVTRGQFASFLNRSIENIGKDVPSKELTLKEVSVKDSKTLAVVLSDGSKHEVKLSTALKPNEETEVTFTLNKQEFTTTVKYTEELTVKTVKVVDETHLQVTLSDNVSHDVKLEKKLPENDPTEVEFTIDGKKYTAKVTFVVEALKITNMELISGTQFKIDFNQPILESSVINKDNKLLTEALKLTNLEKQQAVNLTDASVAFAADKRSITVTVKMKKVDGQFTTLEGRHNVVVNKVKAVAGATLPMVDQNIMFAKDVTAPKIIGTERAGANEIIIEFSEPMQAFSSDKMDFRLPNGKAVTGISGGVDDYGTKAKLNLANAKTADALLEPGAKVEVTMVAAKDIAGNLITPNPATVTINKGEKDGIKPEFKAIEQLGPHTFSIAFSEAILPLTKDIIEVKFGDDTIGIKSVTPAGTDGKTYNVEVEESTTLDKSYVVKTKSGKNITDLSGEVNSFSVSYGFATDKKAPQIKKVAIERIGNVELAVITFDKAINNDKTPKVKFEGDYTLNNILHPNVSTSLVKLKVDKDFPTQATVDLAELLGENDKAGAAYTGKFVFQDVESLYGVTLEEKATAKFTRGTDVNEHQLRVKDITSDDKDNNIVRVKFDQEVDAKLATDVKNYSIDGATVERAVVTYGDEDEVTLYLKQDATKFTGERDITVRNIQAKNSTIAMESHKGTVTLRENIRPVIVEAKSVVSGEDKITLTFSEAITGADVKGLYDIKVVGTDAKINRVDAVTTGDDADKQVVITLEDVKLAHPQKITVNIVNKNGDVKDKVGNTLQDTKVEIIVPKYIEL